MEGLVYQVRWLCRRYQECRGNIEQQEGMRKVIKELEAECKKVRGKMDISDVELLLALLDAYEVTREEEMLQEVLDVVSANMGRLEVSAESVRLLAYCYYYVEEEECAVKAKQMLEELRRKGAKEEKLAEAERIVEELVGEQ